MNKSAQVRTSKADRQQVHEWKKLPGNSFSSWYTKVTDGFGGTTVSDVMRFKTGAVSKSGKTYNLAGFKKKELVVNTPNSLINLDGPSPITEGIVLKASATLKGRRQYRYNGND